MGAPYPAYREADVVLRDGATVNLRPVRSGDEAALLPRPWRPLDGNGR